MTHDGFGGPQLDDLIHSPRAEGPHGAGFGGRPPPHGRGLSVFRVQAWARAPGLRAPARPGANAAADLIPTDHQQGIVVTIQGWTATLVIGY